MAIFDLMSMVAVVTVLCGEGVSKMRVFTFDGFTFVPVLLPFIAYEISEGKIGVTYSSTLGSKAIYNSTENKFYLGFLSSDTESRRALVIHEATHAICDFQSKKMDVATS